MINGVDLQSTKSFSDLNRHYASFSDRKMMDLFDTDPERVKKFSIKWNEFVLDYSKNIISEETIRLLINLAGECGLAEAIQGMFGGEKINKTENRMVLHTALRDRTAEKLLIEGKNILEDIRRVLEQMRDFTRKVHDGTKCGYTGKRFKTIINIGIGGSDLGPGMAAEALTPYHKEGIRVIFVSNVDATHIQEALKGIDHETTLFIVVSKTFTTQETMTNARTARKWFVENAGDENAVSSHFIAVSTNIEAVKAFGIADDSVFEFWDWVGGRYSIWSAVGLPLCMAIGYDAFEEMLQGAHEMDLHFRNTEFSQNMPVIMALLGIWYINFFNAPTHAVIPYDQYLSRFPAYLQQTDMESNGKSVNRSGKKVHYHTGPVVWGGAGTNSQHAFFQLIHQGTELIPADFIAPAISHHPNDDHHLILLSNFFAQTEALMKGKSELQVKDELLSSGMKQNEVEFHTPFRVFMGDKPSNSILIKKLSPFNLGALMALYEHKIFTQGIIWNIFSFDQWGVELGKQLASGILPELQTPDPINSHDSSTNFLINTWKKMTEGGSY